MALALHTDRADAHLWSDRPCGRSSQDRTRFRLRRCADRDRERRTDGAKVPHGGVQSAGVPGLCNCSGAAGATNNRFNKAGSRVARGLTCSTRFRNKAPLHHRGSGFEPSGVGSNAFRLRRSRFFFFFFRRGRVAPFDFQAWHHQSARLVCCAGLAGRSVRTHLCRPARSVRPDGAAMCSEFDADRCTTKFQGWASRCTFGGTSVRDTNAGPSVAQGA